MLELNLKMGGNGMCGQRGRRESPGGEQHLEGRGSGVEDARRVWASTSRSAMLQPLV